MNSAESGPQRTCVACRQTKNKKELVRYVLAPDKTVLVDYRQHLPGRGGYTCFSVTCLQDAVEQRGFQRCFKTQNLSVDAEQLLGQLTAAVDQKVISLLGMARKSGQLISGSNAIIEALRKSASIALVIIAADISAAIGQKIEALAKRSDIYCVRLYDKLQLGQMLGKEERSVIAVQAGKLADSLLNELHRHRQLVREN
jgi:predicted RNA-binding protein YlxR (DUF448 family)/ribosomal protein L30E